MANKVMEQIVTDMVSGMPNCKFCHSIHVVKNGHRKGTQYYICKDCARGFVANDALPGMRYPTDTIAKGVYDYYAGVSLNKITQGIEQQWNLSPSDSAIYGWVKKLTKEALKEAKNYHPDTGEKWIADETVIRMKDEKRKYWLINIIDHDTRFLLASKLSNNRSMNDIKQAFEKAKEVAGESPKVIMTDGWRGYEDAIERVFGMDTKHVISTPFERKELSTNIVERWHGTLKDRLRPMRGMDKSETTQVVLEGFVFYYNFMRPHENLDGKTPAEKAGIKFPYKSWFDVAKSLEPQVRQLPKAETTKQQIVNYRIRNTYRKRMKHKKTGKLHNSITATRG